MSSLYNEWNRENNTAINELFWNFAMSFSYQWVSFYFKLKKILYIDEFLENSAIYHFFLTIVLFISLFKRVFQTFCNKSHCSLGISDNFKHFKYKLVTEMRKLPERKGGGVSEISLERIPGMGRGTIWKGGTRV